MAQTYGNVEERSADPARKSYAAFRGHPLHPMLVPLPIGAFIFLVLTDIAFLGTGDPFWARASLWLLIIGTVTGLLAAMVGAVDFFSINTTRRPVGYVHAGGNVAALLLAMVNWGIRSGDPVAGVAPWGIILSLIMFVGLIGTAWAGGELSYRHRVGVMPNDGKL